ELFHGTARRFPDAILAHGLKPGSRQHVHLSTDLETARRVGARHGAPVVLSVASRAMHETGFRFYRSTNGVWLTEVVPPKYLASTRAG
ncbi:MAG: RNA 2'-phosphotransferase, partial [Myxococcota bacterium]